MNARGDDYYEGKKKPKKERNLGEIGWKNYDRTCGKVEGTMNSIKTWDLSFLIVDFYFRIEE